MEILPWPGESCRCCITILFTSKIDRSQFVVGQDQSFLEAHLTAGLIYQHSMSQQLQMKKSFKSLPIIIHSLVSLAEQDDTINLSHLFDMTMYEIKLKLRRVTGLVLKYINMLKAKGKRSIMCKLEAKDLREAEILQIKHIQ